MLRLRPSCNTSADLEGLLEKRKSLYRKGVPSAVPKSHGSFFRRRQREPCPALQSSETSDGGRGQNIHRLVPASGPTHSASCIGLCRSAVGLRHPESSRKASCGF
eukprot:6410228-Pyramimonas_sp.AAC.1